MLFIDIHVISVKEMRVTVSVIFDTDKRQRCERAICMKGPYFKVLEMFVSVAVKVGSFLFNSHNSLFCL